jgi:hypothetical protein
MIPVLCIFHFSIFPFFIAFFTKFWIYTKKNYLTTNFPLMIRDVLASPSCVPGFPAESGSGIVFAGTALPRPAVDKMETFASAPSVQRTR